MRTICCMICETTYDEGDQCAIEGKHSGALYGVCPACRRRCEIGKRVEAMPLAENGFGIGGVSYAAGRNEALREAKGGGK